MASFRDYKANKTARIDLFGDEYLNVRQVSSAEFFQSALPYHRERLELEAAGKLTQEEESRLNLASAFSLVDSWSFDEPLTLENFIEFLQTPELSGLAAQTIRKIDKVASDADAFVQKKSELSSTGSELSGSLTAEPEKKTPKRAAKR